MVHHFTWRVHPSIGTPPNTTIRVTCSKARYQRKRPGDCINLWKSEEGIIRWTSVPTIVSFGVLISYCTYVVISWQLLKILQKRMSRIIWRLSPHVRENTRHLNDAFWEGENVKGMSVLISGTRNGHIRSIRNFGTEISRKRLRRQYERANLWIESIPDLQRHLSYSFHYVRSMLNRTIKSPLKFIQKQQWIPLRWKMGIFEWSALISPQKLRIFYGLKKRFHG